MEIIPSEPSLPAIKGSVLSEESSPPVIEIDPHLLPERQLTQKNQLFQQGLEVLSGLARLAMVWVESREKRLATTTTTPTPTTRDSALVPNVPSTTPISNFNNPGRGRQGGRRRQRRQAKGRR
ncbi:MAG TPA: hypothetical protein G4N98_07280 [Thermoflexia bacterium]|nr:hypothetical protein [Thermoflexia bacterium]